MIPGRYDIRIYRGDTYFGPTITLPDLTPFGGPTDLTTATVTAQIRATPEDATALANFAVTVVDPVLRQVRLVLTPAQTAGLTIEKGVWDVQVATAGGWVGTPLAGKVRVYGEVTR